jgi:hypothetical protein
MPLDYDLDYSGKIAALPKHTGYSTLPPRAGEQFVTLHYSGVNYPQTTRAGELQRILDEASYQLNHDYGQPGAPAYPDGLLYDVVILSDGTRVRTRAAPVQLWHCGNATGNRLSYAIHLMLGPKQDATAAQWAAATNVIEQWRLMSSIPRADVLGHNEWPRHDGAPRPNATYTLLPEQSECPGRLLHARLVAYRAQTTPLPRPEVPYRVLHTQAVFESPAPDGKVAGNGQLEIHAGTTVMLDEVAHGGWGHLANGSGFVPVGILEKLS